MLKKFSKLLLSLLLIILIVSSFSICYADIDGNVDFARAVDEINENLRKKTNIRQKKRISNDE